MSDEEQAMNNDVSVSVSMTTSTQKPSESESPISKAMAAHLESLMQGDEADDLGLASAPVMDLGSEAEEDEEWLDDDLTMDESAYADAYADADAEPDAAADAEAEAHASAININTTTSEPISIPIIFGNSSKGGAWDDRDLVTAFDAAKEEFHLHNPGPGSWLDKVTAGLAKGKPLAGAEYGETKWYTSYDPAEDPIIPRLPHSSKSTRTAQGSGSGSGSGLGARANQNQAGTGKKEKGGKKRKRAEAGGAGAGVGNMGAMMGDPRNNQKQTQAQAQTQGQGQGKRVRIDNPPVALGSIVNPYLPYNSSTTSASASTSLSNNNHPATAWSSRTNNPYLPNPTSASSSGQGQGQGQGQGYRPVVPDYQPTSPVYTPASPNYQPGELSSGQLGEDEEGRGTGMEVDGFGRTIPDPRAEAGAGTGSAAGEGGKRLLGPVILDAARYRLPNLNGTATGGSTGTGGATGQGRRLPNYAGLASPSPSPPPANLRGGVNQGPQQAYQPQQPQARPRAPQQDPTYEATSSGVYPSMGTSGFSSGVEMNREVAVSRAVNAQWWAGYWFAMSEVLPPSEGQ